MSKSITVEYTKPGDGSEATKVVTIDIERYRVDSELGATENFFLKANGSGVSDTYECIDDLVADLLDGRPSKGKKNVVQALIDTNFTADGVALSVTPSADIAGFQANVPCVVLDKYGHVKGYFIPIVIGADMTLPAANEGRLAVDAKVGWVVQQLQPFLSSLGANSQLGVKAQSEKPTTPTGVTGAGAVAGGINVNYTKPSDAVIQYYDIYCYKTTKPNVIEPNAQPSVLDRAASAASTAVNLTQYFDETDMVLKNLDAGTYFVAVVAKDGAGQVNVNESALAWSAGFVIA